MTVRTLVRYNARLLRQISNGCAQNVVNDAFKIPKVGGSIVFPINAGDRKFPDRYKMIPRNGRVYGVSGRDYSTGEQCVRGPLVFCSNQ